MLIDHVTARQHETLDAVVWRCTGSSALLEQAIALNPHLLKQIFLPAGTVVRLPRNYHNAVKKSSKIIKLW